MTGTLDEEVEITRGPRWFTTGVVWRTLCGGGGWRGGGKTGLKVGYTSFPDPQTHYVLIYWLLWPRFTGNLYCSNGIHKIVAYVQINSLWISGVYTLRSLCYSIHLIEYWKILKSKCAKLCFILKNKLKVWNQIKGCLLWE